MAPISVGIVGTGAWARAAHLPAFSASSRAKIVALAGVDAGEMRDAATEFDVAQTFPSAEAMISAVRPDLIAIVTPDDMHVEAALAALAAGAHVLCEKPLAVSVDEAGLLAETAARSAGRTRMGFTLRYAPAVRYLHQIVASGGLGELRTLQAFQQNGQFLSPDKPFHWKMDGARTGGGAIVEYGIHTLDLARWLMGEAVAVAASSRTQVSRRPLIVGGERDVTVDDSTGWLLEFESGATGVCHAGWATTGRGPGLELRVFGSRGAARCVLSDDLPGGEGIWLADAVDQRFLPAEVPRRFSAGIPAELPWWQRFQRGLVESFLDEIEGSAPPECTFVDGLAAQRLLAATVQAGRERRWVDVERS